MTKTDEAENCIRKRITINDENYYLVVGTDFVMATVPYENRPERMNERRVVETLCDEITTALGGE